ncbi:hypothetical protein PFISCL1PPCAC_17331, partial [Pristionchus fissidentatus]
MSTPSSLNRLAAIAFLVMLHLMSTVEALLCYQTNNFLIDDSDPAPCPKADQVCFAEFFAANKSGVFSHHYNRFCVHPLNCVLRNLPLNRDIELVHLEKVIQDSFYKH